MGSIWKDGKEGAGEREGGRKRREMLLNIAQGKKTRTNVCWRGRNR